MHSPNFVASAHRISRVNTLFNFDSQIYRKRQKSGHVVFMPHGDGAARKKMRARTYRFSTSISDMSFVLIHLQRVAHSPCRVELCGPNSDEVEHGLVVVAAMVSTRACTNTIFGKN